MTRPHTLRPPDRPVARSSFRVWGGDAEVLVTEPTVLGLCEQALVAELDMIGGACSRFRADSEISALNSAGGRATAVSTLFLEFLEVAVRAAVVTDGAVDPTCGSALVALGYDRDFAEMRAGLSAGTAARHGATPVGTGTAPVRPGRHRGAPAEPVAGWQVVDIDRTRETVRVPPGVALDFGATAKAHAADRAASRLSAEFGCGVLVNLAGDLAVAGPAPAGGWPVRVADGEAVGPTDPGQTIAVHDGGVATSGTTVRTWLHGQRRVHHIIDPATGDPAAVHWQTVTAVAGSCVDANILTTAALVRGPDLIAYLDSTGCPMRLLGRDGRITLLNGWPKEDTVR